MALWHGGALYAENLHFLTDEGRLSDCRGGAAIRCFEAAVKARTDAGGNDEKLRSAYALFDRGCRGGYSPACREWIRKKPEFDFRSVDDIILELSRECKAGAAHACFYQGLSYIYIGEKLVKFKQTPQQKGEKTAKFLAQSCNGGIAAACTESALLLMNLGNGAEADQFLRRGCNLGDAFACSFQPPGSDFKRTPAVARVLYSRGCGLHEVNSCYLLAGALEISKDRKEREESRRLYLRACELGILRGCQRAAAQDVGRDELDVARDLLGQSCAMGDSESCFMLGKVRNLLYEDGRPDYRRAAEFYGQECASGDGRACAQKAIARELAAKSLFAGYFVALKNSLARSFRKMFKLI